MLIVVAIIAILVAIAVPALSTAKSDAQEAKLKSAKSAIALAANRAVLQDKAATGDPIALTTINKYMLINGVAPTTWDEVCEGTGVTALTSEAETLAALSATRVYPGGN